MVHVLVAPQEFKESLTAKEAARSIAQGIAKARRDWTIEELPLSDGGPGFIDILSQVIEGQPHATVTHDPLGRIRTTHVLEVTGTKTWFIESALANGLSLTTPDERAPLQASTEGVGELISAALKGKARRLVIGVGGSATSDGGSGMARALGARFLNSSGFDLEPGTEALAELARIDWSAPDSLIGVEVVIATDVTNPLTGPEGAAVVFGPQKGASTHDIEKMETSLRRYAAIVEQCLGVSLAEKPGAGAAGGLAGGLMAFLGGRITSGFDVVAKATGLEERVRHADIVVTGEGSFDGQSEQGKTVGRVQQMAAATGTRCVVLAGRALKASGELRTIDELEPDMQVSMRNAADLLQELAEDWGASTSV
ncbi:MAG: glycerate kinase [Dehalococcoidia bacterium]|nr:glycerate kinase [Dehalococcoidia bacterium]